MGTENAGPKSGLGTEWGRLGSGLSSGKTGSGLWMGSMGRGVTSMRLGSGGPENKFLADEKTLRRS
jgi:hypothetical protein